MDKTTNSEKQNYIQKKEDKGREAYVMIFSGKNYNHFFSTNPSTPWDVITENILKDSRILAEIKTRRYALSFFKKYSPFLEQKKLFGIQRDATTKKLNIKDYYYINIASDGFQVYKIDSNYPYEWMTKKLPLDDYSNYWVDKIVAELPKSHLIYERRF